MAVDLEAQGSGTGPGCLASGWPGGYANCRMANADADADADTMIDAGADAGAGASRLVL